MTRVLYIYHRYHQLAEHARRMAVVLRRRGYIVQEVQELPAAVFTTPALTIAFGLHVADMPVPPTPYVIVQLEQLGSNWFTNTYWERLRNATAAWDFSRSHVEPLRARGVNATYIPFGRQEVMSPSSPALHAIRYDVLFLGAPNERRTTMLNELRAAGLRVHHAEDAFGADADALLDQAALVLNWHYYPNATLEQLRIIPALERGKLVISEASRDPLPIADYVNTTSELVERCRYWLRQTPHARYEQACRYLAAVPSLDAVLPWAWLRQRTGTTPITTSTT